MRVMLINRILKVFFVAIFFMVGGLSSCKTSRMEFKTEKQLRQRETKVSNQLLQEYDKKYRRQTKMQGEQQRKMIKKSRRNPKTMRPSKPFFLWRWLGIR